MHIFELCDAIRRRPAIYLDGDKSIKRLRSFLVGYEAGVGFQAGSDVNQRKLIGAEDIRSFNDWVAKRLGYGNSTSGWCNMILSRTDSDEKAFDMFFQLLDEFRKTILPQTW
jgi:hypothetical protein